MTVPEPRPAGEPQPAGSGAPVGDPPPGSGPTGSGAPDAGRGAGPEPVAPAAPDDPVDEPQPPLLSDGGLLALLVLDGALLAVAGLAFTPLYIGGFPAPLGALASGLLLPWLVHRAAEVDARPAVAGAPLSVWALTIGVLGFVGPGGDVLLPLTWPTLLLLIGGLAAGLLALRAALDREYEKGRSG